MVYAPILIPTLCRSEHFIRCIESLKKNGWSTYTDIYVALDYPAKGTQWEGYNKIKEYLKGEFPEFASFNVIVREVNYGSARNMSELRNDILKKYDRFIRTDDDCEFSPDFIEYMDKTLDKYENDKSVVAVTGYSYPLNWHVSNKANIFKSKLLFSMWGTGFWKSKFLDLQTLFNEPNYFSMNFNKDLSNGKMRNLTQVSFDDYTEYGTSYMEYKGLLNFFSDRALTVYLQLENKYIITPVLSKVRNNGFDGSGVYCLNTLEKNEKKDDSQAYNYQAQNIDSDNSFEIKEDVLEDEQGNKKIIDSFDRVPKGKRIKMMLRCFLYKSLGKTKYLNIMRKRKNSDWK